MQIFFFFGLVIAILAILFAVQNNDPATVSFIAWEFEGSLALILLIALAVGALISFLISLPNNIKVRWAVRTQRKKINELETGLADQKAKLEEAQKKTTEGQEKADPGKPPVV
jgi:uncharacterized integral membrane protein